MADSVVTSDKSSTSLLNHARIICHVCQKQFSEYTCPRCNSRYCSLQCYKSHSLRCTESFMKENVVQELHQMQPDEQAKHKMLDILKRFHSEEEMDSMEEDASADSNLSEETMEKILSGQAISFDDLSLEEKKRFHRAIACGELSKMIKPWEPWWTTPSARKIRLSKEGTQLVQPLSEQESQDEVESDESSDIPPGPETPLPPLNKLSSKEPSPLLTVHLVDILYSYCFTLRVYNGDWRSDPLGSVMVVLSVSSVLGRCDQPETVMEALSHCLEQTCSPAYRHMGGLQFGLGVVDDVISLLALGSSALVCALCDMRRLVQEGGKENKSERRPRRLRKDEIRSAIMMPERKIYFIMCWVHEQPEEAWSSLAAIVGAEKDFALLPKWFVRDNPVIRPFQNALLTDPANNTFSVGLRTVDGDKGIEGFQEICQAHHINGTVRVHYTYIRGSQFNIRIFLDEYTEVAYIVQEDSDDDYLVQEEDDSDDEEELAWLSDITEARSFGRQCLHVPASVVLRLIPHRPPSLNIILPDDNLDVWILKWADGRPNSVEFGHDWYEFGKEKRIRTRDQLRFYKTRQPDTYRLEVRRH